MDLEALTPEYLAELETSELEKLSEELEYLVDDFNTTQMALKILINALYGALANKHFLLANPDLAAGITSAGRFFIQLLALNLEETLQGLLPCSKPYVCYGDTDSVVYNTKIRTDRGIAEIGKIFDDADPNTQIVTESGNEVRKVNGLKSLTYSMENGLEFRDIPYVMRHKVKKRMFRVKVNGKSLDITEDHSLMVIRNGKLQECKPSEIAKGDRLVTVNGMEPELTITDDFTIEDLGIVEDFVYDIEVEGTHCFFGNDILAHNSVYYQVAPFVTKKFENLPDASIEEKVEWADQFEKRIGQKVIQDTIQEFAEILNVMNPDVIGVEREIIADSAVFVAKKKYFARVRDSEGVRFPIDDPYIKIMGLEVARSSTPPWVKMKLQESINVILDTDTAGVKRWRDGVKAEFANQPILDISMVAGISSLDYNIDEKGVPQGPKSAIAHNNWVKANNLEDEIETLKPGEKYKRCYLKTPNRFGTDVLSFEGDKIANIIADDKIFDYQTNFEKYFEKPLENMVGSIGMDISSRPVFDEW